MDGNPFEDRVQDLVDLLDAGQRTRFLARCISFDLTLGAVPARRIGRQSRPWEEICPGCTGENSSPI